MNLSFRHKLAISIPKFTECTCHVSTAGLKIKRSQWGGLPHGLCKEAPRSLQRATLSSVRHVPPRPASHLQEGCWSPSHPSAAAGLACLYQGHLLHSFVFAHLTLYYTLFKSMCTAFLSSLQYTWDHIMNTDSQWQKYECRKTYFPLENRRVKTELSGDPVGLTNSIINPSVTQH